VGLPVKVLRLALRLAVDCLVVYQGLVQARDRVAVVKLLLTEAKYHQAASQLQAVEPVLPRYRPVHLAHFQGLNLAHKE
jgi:hypothetical protein